MHRHETLERLAREHGDAFYLLDLARFRSNLRELAGSFRAHWPRTVLGYSYKTNWTPLVCRTAHEEGCLAEVVSRMELELALRLGVPGERILFNGPLKTAEDLERALLAGVQVNVDALAEVAAIEALAARHPGVTFRVGVRANIVPGEDARSRFGLAGDELREAVARLRALPGVVLAGLHGHVSGHRTVAGVRRRAEQLAAHSLALFPDGPPPTIDLGGGIYGRLPDSLRSQIGEVPSWDELAEAVGAVLAAAWPGSDGPTLILEPGASVVADAFSLACRVAAIKRLDGRDVAVVTGSLQEIKAAPTRVRLPLSVVRAPDPDPASLAGPVDIGGYTCMEGDVLQEAVPGPVGIGDWIVIDNVGSYTTSFKPPFIRPAPAILATDGADPAVRPVVVARRAETLDDLLAAFRLDDGGLR